MRADGRSCLQQRRLRCDGRLQHDAQVTLTAAWIGPSQTYKNHMRLRHPCTVQPFGEHRQRRVNLDSHGQRSRIMPALGKARRRAAAGQEEDRLSMVVSWDTAATVVRQTAYYGPGTRQASSLDCCSAGLAAWCTWTRRARTRATATARSSMRCTYARAPIAQARCCSPVCSWDDVHVWS